MLFPAVPSLEVLAVKDDLACLIAFNRWATERSLGACRLVSDEDYVRPFPEGVVSLRSTVTHVVGATMTWIRRIDGEDATSLPTETEIPTLDGAIVLAEHAQSALDRMVGTLTDQRRNTLLTYRNLAKVEKALPLWAILRHVVNHASYHRGQIATKLKAFGVVAPSTDFIGWAYAMTDQE